MKLSILSSYAQLWSRIWSNNWKIAISNTSNTDKIFVQSTCRDTSQQNVNL